MTDADAWLAGARQKLATAPLGPRVEQIGRVEEAGDGIALVSGLPDARLDELLRFEKGQFGFAQMLEPIASAAYCWTMPAVSRREPRSSGPEMWCACR